MESEFKATFCGGASKGVPGNLGRSRKGNREGLDFCVFALGRQHGRCTAPLHISRVQSAPFLLKKPLGHACAKLARTVPLASLFLSLMFRSRPCRTHPIQTAHLTKRIGYNVKTGQGQGFFNDAHMQRACHPKCFCDWTGARMCHGSRAKIYVCYAN